MVKVLERISDTLDKRSKGYDQSLPLVSGRTAFGELPADGGFHLGDKVPDYTQEYGGLPLVAPGTRSVGGEVASAQKPQVGSVTESLPLALPAPAEQRALPAEASSEVSAPAQLAGNVAVTQAVEKPVQ